MGGGLNGGEKRSKPSESIVWGYQEEYFLHNFFVGLPSSVNSTVFQAHYCRGVASASRHLIAVRTVELLLLVLYSIAMSNHRSAFVFILLVGKVLGKLGHPLHGLKTDGCRLPGFFFVCFFVSLAYSNRNMYSV